MRIGIDIDDTLTDVKDELIDFVKYAEAFGAKGLRVTSVAELEQAIEEGFKTQGPVIIDIPIDYRDNEKLGETILPDQFY